MGSLPLPSGEASRRPLGETLLTDAFFFELRPAGTTAPGAGRDIGP